MAVTVSEQVAKIVTPAGAGFWTRVDLPLYCKFVWVRPVSLNAFFNFAGTDGGAVSGAATLSANTLVQIETSGYPSIYVASNGTVQVLAYCIEVD